MTEPEAHTLDSTLPVRYTWKSDTAMALKAFAYAKEVASEVTESATGSRGP